MTTTRTSIARRRFLQATAAATGVLAAQGSSLGSGVAGATARALTPPGGPPGKLVQVFLRGGQDGLSTVVPYTEAAYYTARPTISVPPAAVLDLDGQFGLHPALPKLHALYQQERLAVVVGVGHPSGERSHFAAQDLWEYGSFAIPDDRNGWLGRYLAATSAADGSLFRGLTLGNNVNLSLRGFPALGIAAIERFGLGGSTGATAELETLLRLAYVGASRIETTGILALDAANQVSAVEGSTDPNPVTQAFADTARLLDSDLGVEVVTANIGGWDTHAGMGTHTEGEMRTLLAGLDDALGDFQADLDARGRTDVTTVVLTEFGRRVAENGAGGTEHGSAMVMLVLGDHVRGGQVHGTWAGLAPSTIGARGDVVVTTDFRDVLGDLAVGVLGVDDPGILFPDHTYTPFGITV